MISLLLEGIFEFFVFVFVSIINQFWNLIKKEIFKILSNAPIFMKWSMPEAEKDTNLWNIGWKQNRLKFSQFWGGGLFLLIIPQDLRPWLKLLEIIIQVQISQMNNHTS